MSFSKLTSAMLGATALGLAFAAPVAAQTSTTAQDQATQGASQTTEGSGSQLRAEEATAPGQSAAQTSRGGTSQDEGQQSTTAQGTASPGAATQGESTGQSTNQTGSTGTTESGQGAGQSAETQSSGSSESAQQQSSTGGSDQGTAANSGGSSEQGAAAEATQTKGGGSEGDQAGAQAQAGTEVAVSDLTGREVTTPDGEKIGKIDRFVEIGGEPKAIFERGGFFGIGSKDVAVPAGQLAMRGDQLILNGVSTDQFQAMPVLEDDSGSELAADDTVRIGASK